MEEKTVSPEVKNFMEYVKDLNINQLYYLRTLIDVTLDLRKGE